MGMKTAICGIWRRAHDLANSDDLVDSLSVLEHKACVGWPEKVTNGIQESAAIRNLLYENRNKIVQNVAEDHNISLARSTVKRIAYDHRDEVLPYVIVLVRGVKQIKLFFKQDIIERHLEYSE